jgi:hypothetical protein
MEARAVSEAMKRAIGRAHAALEQKGQKVGALRFASLDVRQIIGIARIQVTAIDREPGGFKRFVRPGEAGRAIASAPSCCTPGKHYCQRDRSVRFSDSIAA